MKCLKTILVLALVALWVPATLHCKLEELPGLQFLACCDHKDNAPHQDDDCRTDSCAMVEGGLYKTSNPKVTIPAPASMIVFDLTSVAAAGATSSLHHFQFFTGGSPELPVTWQFSLRAALPPRAPSPVS